MGSGRNRNCKEIFWLWINQIPELSISVITKGFWKKISGHKLLEECAYVTEDRHLDGLFMQMPIWKNISMANLKKFEHFIMDEQKERDYALQMINEMQIKASDENVLVETLSGGNQQKVVMARSIGKNPDYFLY